jgi:hypothetical protein
MSRRPLILLTLLVVVTALASGCSQMTAPTHDNGSDSTGCGGTITMGSSGGTCTGQN